MTVCSAPRLLTTVWKQARITISFSQGWGLRNASPTFFVISQGR